MSKKRKQRPSNNSSGGSSTSSPESIAEKTCLHWRKSCNVHFIKKYTEKNGIKNKCSTCEKNNVMQQQSVQKDNVTQQQSVQKDNVTHQQSIQKDDVIQQESLEKDIVIQQQSVEKDIVTQQQSVEKNNTSLEQSVVEDKTLQDQTNKTDPSDEAIWMCLYCGGENCGSKIKNHTHHHYDKLKNPHQIAINMKDWTIWCYECKKELTLKAGKRMELINLLIKAMSKLPSSPPVKKTNPVKKSLKSELINKDNSMIPSNDYNKQNDINKTKGVTGVVGVVGRTSPPINNYPKIMGLYNLGNTCFFNSVIQCLARTPYFVKLLEIICTPGEKVVIPGGMFKSAPDSEEVQLPSIKSELEKPGQFTSILYKTMKDMQNCRTQQSTSPRELIDALKKKSMYCMDGGQHDAHEFIRHLLDVVRNEDVKRYQSVIIKKLNLQNKSQETVDNITKATVKFYGSQVNKKLLGPEPIFKGALVSTLNCSKCGHSSVCTEPFLDLSLPVTADKPQPPAYKRKNNSYDETYDMKGNSYSNTIPTSKSKYQQKKEKKAMRKNRQNKIFFFDDFMTEKPDNIIEENGVLESDESDADIEDNIEGESISREVGESGYSSEKASAFSSPVSPTNYKINNNQRVTTPDNLDLSTDKNQDYKSIDNLETSLYYNNDNNSALKEATFSSIENMLPLFLSDSDKNSSDSNKNHNNQELTATPVSSPTESKDSTSTLFDVQNRSVTPTDKVERILSISDNSDDSITNKQISLTHNLRSLILYKKTNSNLKQKMNIGINNITSDFSQMGITNNTHHTPTKYPKKDEYSIQSCLNEFTMIELMTGSNEVSCEKCTEAEKKIKPNSTKTIRTPHTKQYLISRAPPVLILQLKRFQACHTAYKKIGRRVEFPMMFDLSPVCKNIKAPRMYALYGVIEHLGSTIDNGHYVSYVKTRTPLSPNDSRWSFLPKRDQQNSEELYNDANSEIEEEEATVEIAESMEPPPGKWYCVSDARVTEVDETTVQRCQAYLLFYERIL